MRKDKAFVFQHLFIGNCASVADEHFLREEEIALIINASNRSSPVSKLMIPTIQILDIEDVVPATPELMHAYVVDITAKANAACAQMHKYISEGKNVLVHCLAGINRSAFILAMYMITKMDFTADAAIGLITLANSDQRRVETLSNPLLRRILYEVYNAKNKHISSQQTKMISDHFHNKQ